MAARYHLIKITKRNIADFDFRLKVCARHHTYRVCVCIRMNMHMNMNVPCHVSLL